MSGKAHQEALEYAGAKKIFLKKKAKKAKKNKAHPRGVGVRCMQAHMERALHAGARIQAYMMLILICRIQAYMMFMLICQCQNVNTQV